MIGSLRGRVLDVQPASFLLEVQGVGFVVKASLATISSVKAGEERFLYIHDHVREDSHDLFGFVSRDEQDLFERLLSVSGVGPKVGLTILSTGPHDAVRRAILNGDIAFLTSVPGVGKKTAQKIILDLKGQLVEEGAVAPGDSEVMEALVSLGYSASQVRDVMKFLPAELTDVAARIREALRYLSK